MVPQICDYCAYQREAKDVQREKRKEGKRERRDMTCVCEMRSGTALVDTGCIWPRQEAHARQVYQHRDLLA